MVPEPPQRESPLHPPRDRHGTGADAFGHTLTPGSCRGQARADQLQRSPSRAMVRGTSTATGPLVRQTLASLLAAFLAAPA